MRNILHVIAAIESEIPQGKEHDQLRWGLNRIKRDVPFTAPENPIRWHRLAETLEAHIGEPVEVWQLRIQSIMKGEIKVT